MKYNDRKDAKRKYKQALLATVTTMTLGVSTLGSTASTFAEEKKTEVQPQQATPNSNSLGAGGGSYESDALKALTDKINMDYLKKAGSVAADTLKAAYKDAHTSNGNYNNTFRTLTMTTSALIPYGGVLISPIIGLLWPEDLTAENNKMAALIKQLDEMMDTKVTDHVVRRLKTEVNDVKKQLELFEQNVNTGKHKSGSGLYSLTEEDGNAIDAKDIHKAFNSLLEHSKEEMQEVAALPIYTAMATAHLEFLHFLEQNGTKPIIGFTSNALSNILKTREGLENETFGQKIKDLADKYTKHVQETYNIGRDKYMAKMQAITTHSMNENDEYANLAYLKSLDDTRSEMGYPQSKIDKIKNDIKNYQNLIKEKADFRDQTAENAAFKLTAMGKWNHQGDKWYYINNQGENQTGWLQDGSKYYYFSPEKTDKFEKGQMVTGKVTIDKGETYYFNPHGGQMQTGWIQDDGKQYYFSPANNTKNYDNETFKEGQMMTGWLAHLDHYYYMSPGDDKTNPYQKGKTFKKGEMWTGWLENPKKANEWYYMTPVARDYKVPHLIGNDDHIIRPVGSMLHDEYLEKQDSGDGWRYYFNESGINTHRYN
ncbi:insecticidal delta-endotoxin Cry8Ea1 family protein [Bacillus thuringiensis]|uniref:insecticidal delta-endotoxin Cry8Ea1 family protein n=1 Tax=Bacillus thuringiensis TaxID=1428 RepID=UPI0011A2333D|nr:insecticidal delta-endotoxin Cry8Ea1 family protein [Bacillus thuringiensis]